MSGWLDSLAHAPDGLMFFVVIAALFALLGGFSGMRRVRHIEDVPTARVRSAPQGYVELVGVAQALDGEPIIAPLSQTVCCWYDYRVDRRSGKHWRNVQSESSDAIFILRDDTGDCLIDPEGAEVSSRHTRNWSDDGSGWGGTPVHARLPSLGKAADLVVKVGGSVLESLSGVGEYRYRESVILAGDPLYVIGEFKSLGGGDHPAALRDLTGAILREWKQRPETLRERFDSNRDGTIDVDEWERARDTAEREALREQGEAMRRGQIHTLGKPVSGGYFLVSNLEEFGLLRRFRWRKRLGFVFFALLAGVALMMLATRI